MRKTAITIFITLIIGILIGGYLKTPNLGADLKPIVCEKCEVCPTLSQALHSKCTNTETNIWVGYTNGIEMPEMEFGTIYLNTSYKNVGIKNKLTNTVEEFSVSDIQKEIISTKDITPEEVLLLNK